jgi:hypothetical protein
MLVIVSCGGLFVVGVRLSSKSGGGVIGGGGFGWLLCGLLVLASLVGVMVSFGKAPVAGMKVLVKNVSWLPLAS